MQAQMPMEARGIGAPGANGCESPGVSAGGEISVLWKNSKCS